MTASMRAHPSRQTAEEERATSEEIKSAYETYTHAVEQRLKPGLDAVCELRDRTFEELAELEQMSRALDVIEGAGDGRTDCESGVAVAALKTRVNIGEEFYVEGHVYKLDVMIVDVGLGIFVEMGAGEVREFVQMRREGLEGEGERYSERIAEIQAHLKTVMKSLGELRLAAPVAALPKVEEGM